jgi:error-prone DNA polymerase
VMAQVPVGFGPVGDAPDPAQDGSGSSGDQPAEPHGDAQEHTRAGGMGRRRVLVHPSGFKQSPYADIKPAGIPVTSTRTADALPATMAAGPGAPPDARQPPARQPPAQQPPAQHPPAQHPPAQAPPTQVPTLSDGGGADAPRKLWHSSQGSSGR